MTDKPTSADLIALIEKMDREQIQQVYYKAIHAMQQKMSADQHVFK